MKLTKKNMQYLILISGIVVALLISNYIYQSNNKHQNNNSLGRHYFIDITNVQNMINNHRLVKSL